MINRLLNATFAGCEAGCLSCGEANEAACEIMQAVHEIEKLNAEIWQKTGSKKVARLSEQITKLKNSLVGEPSSERAAATGEIK